MLHLSDLKKYQRCEKYYWLSTLEKKPFFPFATINENIVELIQKYFHFENVFMGERGDEPSRFLEAYDQYQVFMNVRLAYMSLRVSVPCLVKKDGQLICYFYYNQCYPKESEAQKIADTCFVLEKNNIHVDDVKIVHLNAHYVRQGELNIEECLLVSDYLFNDRNKANHTIKELVQGCQRDLTPLIQEIEACGDMSQVTMKRTNRCTSHCKCEFFHDCFPANQHDTSILNLVQSSKKYDCEAMGLYDMAMIQGDEIEGTRVQYAQIMAAKKQGFYCDKPALGIWLQQIQYPITYLDFEWETFVYPPYDGMKPFDVLVFQYSMHIQKEKGTKCFHEQFLKQGDCRRAFVEDLIRKIPKTGSILVFNAQGAEALRLQQLATQFPEYHDDLEQIWKRMVDLAIPFSNGVIYDTRMAGEYNLKKLLSLFSDLSYDDLEINQGLLAVKKWREMSENESEKEAIEKALFEYCGMDTYSMVVLLKFLYEVIEK